MSCYSPNGTIVDDASFGPCNSVGGQFSMCCAINKSDADTCLPNGLCKWITNGETQYFRNSCSDESWDSPFCLNQCLTSGLTNSGRDDARVSQCPDGSWCCGNDAENSCCSSGSTFILAATVGVSSTSSSAATTSTAAASTTSLISSITTTPATSAGASTSPSATSASSSSGLSTGAQAGIGVGVALGALIVIGLVGGLIWRKKKNARAGNYAGEPARHEIDGSQVQRMSEMGPSKPEVYAKHGPEPTQRHELA